MNLDIMWYICLEYKWCLPSSLGCGRRSSRLYCEVTKLLEGSCPRARCYWPSFPSSRPCKLRPFALGRAPVAGPSSGPVNRTWSLRWYTCFYCDLGPEHRIVTLFSVNVPDPCKFQFTYLFLVLCVWGSVFEKEVINVVRTLQCHCRHAFMISNKYLFCLVMIVFYPCLRCATLKTD